MPLDDTISVGQSGHITDHQTIATTLNGLGTASTKSPAELAADSAFTGAYGPVRVAAPTGVAATDTANLQAALNAGGVVQLHPGVYVTNAPLTIPEHDTTIRGTAALSSASTARGTWIQNATTDLFSVTGSKYGIIIEDLTLQSSVGGGHIFAADTAILSHWVIRRVTLSQQNNTKSLFRMTAGSMQACSFFDIQESVASGSSVSAWSIVGTGGGINSCQWGRIWHNAGSSSESYAFDVQNSDASTVADLRFEDIVMEITNGGCIRLLSAVNCVIDHCDVFDLTTTVADLFVIGKTASGLTSKFNKIRQVVRHGGTLGPGLVDVKLQTSGAPLTTIESCGQGTLSGFSINVGTNNGVKIRDGHTSDAITNKGSDTVVDQMGALILGGLSLPASSVGAFVKPGLWIVPPGGGTNSGVGAHSDDTLYLTPIGVSRDVTATSIGVRVFTITGVDAGAVLRLGIYRDNGNGFPGDLVIEAGTVAVATAGTKTIAISQALSAGIYWVGGAFQGSPTQRPGVCVVNVPPYQLGMSALTNGSAGCYQQGSVFGALPATFAGTTDHFHGLQVGLLV